jgi:lipid II:glycine glycyltransferase (peptidoglycan interpeptide bridge formation enzyme)
MRTAHPASSAARSRPVPPPAPRADLGAERWRAWDAFLAARADTGFMQTSWWADFRRHAGYEHFAAVLRQDGAIVGGAMVMKYVYAPRRCFYYVPEGPAVPLDDEELGAAVFDAILEAVDERRAADSDLVSHLRIEPRWTRVPEFVRGFRRVPEFVDPYMEPRSTLCVDLRGSDEAVLAQMKPKGRYNVRLAERRGVTVVEDAGARGLADFMRIYGETARRQRLAAKDEDYFRELLAALRGGRGALYFAEHEGARLATAIAVHFGARTTYFYGGSRGERREVMAPYLLHFEIMRRARARGSAWYDFWGVAPPDRPDHPWRDIGVFKRKFGGVEVPLVPTLDRVFDAAAYEDYVAAEGDPDVSAV